MAASNLPHETTGVTDVDKNRAVVALLLFADHCEECSPDLNLDIIDTAHRVAMHFGIDITDIAPAVREILERYPRPNGSTN